MCDKRIVLFYTFHRFILTASHCICNTVGMLMDQEISTSDGCINPTDKNDLPQDQFTKGLIKMWYIAGHKKINFEEEYVTKCRDAKDEHEKTLALDEYLENLINLPEVIKGYVFENKRKPMMNDLSLIHI